MRTPAKRRGSIGINFGCSPEPFRCQDALRLFICLRHPWRTPYTLPTCRRKHFPICPARALTTVFDRSRLSTYPLRASLGDIQSVRHLGYRLITRSPPPLPCAPCLGAAVGGSRVMQKGQRLVCTLRLQVIQADRPLHPRRVSRRQAFRFPGFQDGYLTPCNHHHV